MKLHLYKLKKVRIKWRFKIVKGVRQGCDLSPFSFNIYVEEALKEVREENSGVIKVGGMLVQILRFVAVITESEPDLTNMLEKMNDTLKEDYTKINQRKTKSLICSKHQIYANIVLDEVLLETIQNFTYLGSKTRSNRRSHTDIVCRIAQVKQVYYKKKNIFTSNRVRLNTRKSFIKSFM